MFHEDWLLVDRVNVFTTVRNYTSIIRQTILSRIVCDCNLLIIGCKLEVIRVIVLLTCHQLHQNKQQNPPDNGKTFNHVFSEYRYLIFDFKCWNDTYIIDT